MNTKLRPEQIAHFWQNHPCGQQFVDASEWHDFFEKYDRFKDLTEPHIISEIAQLDLKGKRILEVGLGQGAEAQKLIQAGAIYNGIDLTPESVARVSRRCDLFKLPYESLQVMNAEKMTFPESSFDMIFSHGVIHHSPRIREIVSEMYRVLKPGGQMVLMLYHRNSLNYQVSIRLFRRMGLLALAIPGVPELVSHLTGESVPRLKTHIKNLKSKGISYLRMDQFIHASTDGPENLHSEVFSKEEAKALTNQFQDHHFTVHFLNERHFPGISRFLSKQALEKLGESWGWHLWVKARKAVSP